MGYLNATKQMIAYLLGCWRCLKTFWKRCPRFLANLRSWHRRRFAKNLGNSFSLHRSTEKNGAAVFLMSRQPTDLSFITFRPFGFFYQRLSNFLTLWRDLPDLSRLIKPNFWTRCVSVHPSFETNQTVRIFLTVHSLLHPLWLTTWFRKHWN